MSQLRTAIAGWLDDVNISAPGQWVRDQDILSDFGTGLGVHGHPCEWLPLAKAVSIAR